MKRENSYGSDFWPGDNFHCGSKTFIGQNVKAGKNVKIGRFCIISDGCCIADDVVIGDYVRLGPETRLKKGVFIDSYVISSGENEIGEFSQIRYQSIIARNVIIGSDVFFCAGVKTAYLNHTGNPDLEGLRIKDKVFVGDNSTILSGLCIESGIVIGAHCLVTENLEMLDGVYIGCPAIYKRQLRNDEIWDRKRRLEKLRGGFS